MQAKHVFSAGSSGGGKTTRLRERHARHDGISVWVNHLGGNDVESVPGDVCTSLSDMISAVRSCRPEELRNLRIDYRSNDQGTGAVDGAKRFGQLVGDEFDGEISTQIIVDECQHVLPDDEDASDRQTNGLAWILAEGRDDNIKGVLSTQDPTEVYYPPIKNCPHFVWVGEVKTWHEGFLRAWGFHNLDLPTENYRYAVIKPTRPPRIIHEGDTDPSF